MASKILLISSGSGFMTDALKSNLKKAGFVIISAEPDIKSIEAGKEDVDLILLLAGDYVYDSADALVYLMDISRDEERPVCLIGYDDELGAIKKYIPETYIKKEFKRPFDAKYVAEGLKALAAAAEEKRLGKHILLVDDDTTFLKMLQGWLSERYRITAVKSGIQAITYMANHRPDLILLDYDMPITPGPQVMEMIRSEFNYRDIPIIFLTGKSDRESIMNVMRLKPQGYFLKTMPRDEIVSAIDDYFAAHRWDGM
ncbi:MAG: response regulator [Lachnospiraceae bacterium]|nr:response regulator [Lachnospiraceae bacterium]